MDRRKKQFCVNNHDTFICGRDSTSHCNECKKTWFTGRSEYNKEYYERTHDYQLARAKEYRDANREDINASSRLYSKVHRKEIEERRRNYDPSMNTQLSILLRNRLNRAIRKNYKVGSSVRDLGCSIEFFKQYLESKFHSGMSWENRGFGNDKWNIDHIIPLSSFDLSDRKQFLEACHYTNMQPLWQQDNLKKGNKILVEGI
jgi:hypothetical protein